MQMYTSQTLTIFVLLHFCLLKADVLRLLRRLLLTRKGCKCDLSLKPVSFQLNKAVKYTRLARPHGRLNVVPKFSRNIATSVLALQVKAYDEGSV